MRINYFAARYFIIAGRIPGSDQRKIDIIDTLKSEKNTNILTPVMDKIGRGRVSSSTS